MESKRWSLLCFVLLVAVGLIIGSSVWSPRVLMGKELLQVGGECEFNKSCEEKDCSSNCDGDKHETCSGSGGSATEGCYDTIGSPNLCGYTEDEKPCGAQYCETCSKCS